MQDQLGSHLPQSGIYTAQKQVCDKRRCVYVDYSGVAELEMTSYSIVEALDVWC